MIDTIINGDCLEVMKDIPAESIDMVLCDLPYGITNLEWDKVIDFEKLWEQYNRITKDNAAIVLNASQPFTTDLINSQRNLFRYELIWEKTMPTQFVNANIKPLSIHENILIFSKHKTTYNPQKWKIDETKRVRKNKKYLCKHYSSMKKCDYINNGERYPLSILKFSNFNGHVFGKTLPGATQHPTQKPVAMYEYLIRTYTDAGTTVLDNCIGSGTTAIACINTDRHYIGIELSPDYCKIANDRIAAAKSQKKINCFEEPAAEGGAPCRT